VNLDRPEITGAFRRFAKTGYGVLIGAPGVGKTHLLKLMVRELQADPQSRCLYLPVDRVPLESDADLRAELGVSGDIVSFFESETRDRHGYLIVDALDAIRGDQPRTYILGLVRRVLKQLSDSWNVILSIRTYDALRSIELEELFPPITHTMPEASYQLPGAGCRHFYIPPLNDHDIEAAKGQLSWLSGLWDGGHDDLRELLRIPFNLWLLEHLFDRGTAMAEVSPIQSEVQLLNLFWRQRVRSGPLEPDQRLLTSRAAKAMVHRKTLWANTDDVYEAGANQGWIALHSAEVLQDANSNGTRVSFSHNVIFDYAVSVEMLSEDATALTSFLRQEPDRTLFLRPTIDYFLARLWFTNRSLFWENFWALFAADEPQVQLVAQVLPPTIVAREARSLDDIEPVLLALEADDAHAEDAVLRVLQAIRSQAINNDEVWPAFAARVAQHMSHSYSWDLARFLADLLEIERQRDQPRAIIRQHISVGARAILRQALELRDPALEHVAAAWLIRVVANTYNVDPDDARDLYRLILSRIADPDMPVNFVYRLADAVQYLWNDDPELAASVYAATFAHLETSDEPTHMGGIVVALTSNRRQDFGLAKYVLIESASRFIREQPAYATQALMQAINGAVSFEEPLDHEVLEETFGFRGKRAHYKPDNSHFWDAPGTVPDDTQKLLEVMLAYLAGLPTGSAELAQVIDVAAENATFAFFWRGLLKAGARDAEKYVPLLHELLSAEPVLSHPETAPEAAAFLAAAVPLLDDTNLGRIENAIADLAATDTDRKRHWAKRLIVQIPENRLTTDAAQELRGEAVADPETSANRPLFSLSTSWGKYDTEDWLRDEGVEVDAAANARVLKATEGIDQFVSQFINKDAVPNDAVLTIIGPLADALELVQAQISLPTALLDTVWARIGEAAAVAARAEPLGQPAFEVLRSALLSCSSGDAPRPTEDANSKFNVAAWSPAARNAAAQGIPRLLQHRVDRGMVDALRRLARDPAPSVRYLVALELPRVISQHEQYFWEVATLYATQEVNRIVQQALGHALAVVAAFPDREQRVVDILDQLLSRVPLTELARSLSNEDQVGGLIVGLAVMRGNEWAAAQLDEAISDAPPAYLSTLVLHLLNYVGYSWIADASRRSRSEAALGWLPQIIGRVHRLLRDEADRVGVDDSNREETIRDLFNVLDHIISRFYFNSGIYEGQGEQRASHEEICAFFGAIRPVLHQLADITGGVNGLGLPARTAHHFVELLRGSLSCDPAEVLHLTRLAIDGAQGAGYSFDPMAAEEVTAIIETTLADHRDIAASGAPLEDLTHVLDTFVRAGWPGAQRLVWRLEELFR